MFRILLPLLLMLAGLGGGVAAGKLLPGRGGTDAAADGGDAGSHAAAEAASAAEGEADTGHGAGSGASGQVEYVRLNNQFIVPLIRNGSVRSMVVMSLTVEVTSGENELVYSREPRLRDAFLRVMFTHANVGGFDGSFTSVEAMTPLREGLREAARQVLGDIAHDVLIVDIVRQDA